MSIPTNLEIGAAVANVRKGLGLTQQQVAKEFCVRGINKDSGQISKMEGGKMSISAVQLYTFADVFGCTIGSFDPSAMRELRIQTLKQELAALESEVHA